MTQASQSSVLISLAVVTVVLLVVMGFVASGINSNLRLVGEKLDNLKVDENALANAIADKIVLPEFPDMPEYDTEKHDRVCELTKGCEYWEPDEEDHEYVNPFGNLYTILMNFSEESFDEAEDYEEDLFNEISDLVDIDEDYLFIVEAKVKDFQIRAYTDDDAEDGNWEVKAFVRVKYFDTDDEDDKETIYLLVISILDEHEYDSMEVEEVTRKFEFN